MLQQLQIPHFLFDRLRKPETALAPLTSKPSSEQLLEKIIDIIIEDVESRTISLRAVRRRLEATFCYPLNDMKQEIKCLVEEATKIIDGGNGYLFD
ncbi:uncharacterized protein MONOS_10919 [Monocercomonoides exilis]|uniref:uncharacterized protein n=1 Tax=Monocercomonoides exilis TaxID=2049356 RepID=UPI00355A546C|nr:hypothetical protein MONOS_10919 [Monocercomonoides exilis]|eukprot:MONOS_10919.1-p1 / transcript=MONOS_10919.1 / gene=MONOS_10919 / organism=Monocercomonoides_exilis_PA203 / gene_product=unspecified product / transcript_product=unspecified product / location=Mono_scaffold00518:22186-22575(+) / protein_length=96 / sequence_SO=supercontig / SO=protein_coding / is_pseudo=false